MLEICNRFSFLDQKLRTETYVLFTTSCAFYWRKLGIKVQSRLYHFINEKPHVISKRS